VHAPRRRSRSRNRILYWFRTPPGVRVGRAPIDEDAIQLIEAHHPDIRFDWAQILRGDEEEEVEREALPEAPPEDAPVSPAHARLGSEGLARLRGRFAEILSAISRRVSDPERQEQLKASAERLNPDSWVTDEEVRQGLEGYEAALASLREVLGRRRRRRRSRSAPVGSETAPDGTAPSNAGLQDDGEEAGDPETEPSQN
jgi:hypothetical protein